MSRRKAPVTPVKRDIKRVVMYRRYSRERGEQTTWHTQGEAINGYCEPRGWEIVAELGDRGISAFKGSHRPDFERSIEMVERGQADAIVVFKLDRFARNMKEFLIAWDRIEAAGGSFVSVMENFDTTTGAGEMMLTMVAGLAQMESQMKSERSIPAARYQKEIGAVGPGPRPYGYDKVNSKETAANKGNKGKGAILTINKREAEVIRSAADWVIAGGSLRRFIIQHSPDSSQPNRKMTSHGLKHSLTNATTAGLREWADAPDGTGFQKGTWKPILDRETWDKVRAILLDPARRSGAQPGDRKYLLSGVMRCQKHGKAVFNQPWHSPKTGETVNKYKCGNPDCWTTVTLTFADEIVTRELFERVSESKWQTWQSSGKGWDSSLIESIESRMRLVDRQMTAGKITESRYLDMMGDLEEQLNAVHNEEPLDIPHVPNLREARPTFSLDDKQKVLRQAFEAIEMVPFKGKREPNLRIQLI